MTHETLAISLGRTDDTPSQREIDSGPPEQARQEIGSANIGQKTDAALRHAETVSLAGGVMVPVQRDAASSTEHESVDERNIRPDECLKPANTRVGGAIEVLDGAEGS